MTITWELDKANAAGGGRFLRRQSVENVDSFFQPSRRDRYAPSACAPGGTPPNRPSDIYPDPVRTPGATNPQVTQQNIKENICNPHWSTRQIRPPSEYTSRLKRKQLREYGDTVHQTRADLINPSSGKVDTTRCVAHSDNMACYEEDHPIPLEDGGDPTDPKNPWPEPYNTSVGGTIMGSHQKDVVEVFIHDEICHDIPGAKSNSYIPATTSITLRGDRRFWRATGTPATSRLGRGSRAGEGRARNPAGNACKVTATTKMTNLSYDEMDKLTPCRRCGSHCYWFDGELWQSWNCVPPPSADMIRIDLKERVN